MATRAYVRGSNGKFAGSGAGTKVTYGKAGGFANASFRARVQANRANARPATKGKGSAGPSRAKALGKVGARGAGKAAKRVASSKTARNVALAAGGTALAVNGVGTGGLTKVAVGTFIAKKGAISLKNQVKSPAGTKQRKSTRL